ncbi:putative DNA alkylation repair enzyme superfamily [Paratrimastix pyriformis]|uniref:DNA alkylation repair enzyme superfamily n=1 Tax=Paratrimastix pyriformis TaxID=342808 RepID=A0ABQ8U3Q4_9EUKA|nr:putative DNA alkylation repair enzyme superfamily [Paratrimastix pyriformis]
MEEGAVHGEDDPQVQEIIDKMRDMGEKKYAEGQQRFFKNVVKSLGVRTPKIRAYAKEYYKEKEISWDDVKTLAVKLAQQPWLDIKHFSIELLACYQKIATDQEHASATWDYLRDDLLQKGSWGTWSCVDCLCSRLLSALVSARQDILEDDWVQYTNRDKWNLWVRRAAAVALIPLGKKGRQLELIWDVTDAMLDDPEDLAQKAIGWLLKETSKHSQAAVERYLRERHGAGRPLTRTFVRYCLEKFPQAKRRTLLELTSQDDPAKKKGRPGKTRGKGARKEKDDDDDVEDDDVEEEEEEEEEEEAKGKKVEVVGSGRYNLRAAARPVAAAVDDDDDDEEEEEEEAKVKKTRRGARRNKKEEEED